MRRRATPTTSLPRGGRGHRQPRRGARPQRPPQPGAARRGTDQAAEARAGAGHGVPARQHRAHRQGHDPRAVHDVAAGAGRLLRRRRVARPRLRRGVQRGSQGPVRRRGRHRAARRALPAGSARCGSRVRARRAEQGSRRRRRHPAVHLCFGYAAIIHDRPAGYSFLPELADCPVRPGVDRDRPVPTRPGRPGEPRAARPSSSASSISPSTPWRRRTTLRTAYAER